jgi:hypothetical protein
VIVDGLDAAKVKARSLFETLEMPQKRDGLRILDEGGCNCLSGTKGKTMPKGPKGERLNAGSELKSSILALKGTE